MTSEADKPKRPTRVKKPTPTKQTKPVQEKSTKPTIKEIRQGQSEESSNEKAHGQAPIGRGDYYEPVAETIRQILVVEGKGKGIATDDQGTLSLLDQHKPKKKICDTPSPTDAETGADTDKTNSKGDTGILNFGEEQGEDVSNKAGPNLGQSHVAFVGPTLKPMRDEFVATVYPRVHESMKHTTEENVHLENPLSSSGTLLSMVTVPIH
nr:hypothetical protein [Tanacetum cinerariifolium]